MEGYLKNLLDDLDKSQSSEVRIIDDNFNSSFGSLKDHQKRRSKARRANSLNSSLAFAEVASIDDEGSDGSSVSNEVKLSARMERHRQSRWSAAETPRPTVRHSLSPGILRGRKRYTATKKAKSLHTSLEFGNQAVKHHQNKAISAVRDCHDDRAFSKRISPAALSAGLFDDSVGYLPLSSAEVIEKAIAISFDGKSAENSLNRSKTRGRRSRKGRPEKTHSVDSISAPPSIPVRKNSMDNLYDDPETDANVSPKFQNHRLQISTIVLPELSYQKGRKYV